MRRITGATRGVGSPGRGMASSTLNQHPKFQYLKEDWIEFQLAHTEENKVRAAYNALNTRSYLDERRTMVQAYADYLDGLRNIIN